MNKNASNTDLTVLIEPRLPQELERIIFEIAAHDDRNRALPMLMRVARRVRDWLQAIVYDSIVLNDPSFYTTSRSPLHHPPRFPSGPQTLYVRNLLVVRTFNKVESEPEWGDFLPQCHNLQDLAIWTDIVPDTLSLLTSTIQSPLRTVRPCGLLRLSVSLANLFPGGLADFNHEIFKSITHLEVLEFSRESGGQWIEGNNYGCLTSLQYLSAFSFDSDMPYPKEILTRCLEECKALRVLILPFYAGGVEEVKTRRILESDGTICEIPDDRMVVHGGLLIPNDMWSSTWYRGAIGGDDFWIQAEKTVQRRRWKRELKKVLWNSIVDSSAEVDLGEWLTAMETRQFSQSISKQRM
ncbi:hypothetical protein AX16_006661 [Volvariella volvacea WC 439]|nr:hypothetical protein AX16_006661 [Volvariella volvacea WC 439]